MERIRFKPSFDRLFVVIFASTGAIMLALTLFMIFGLPYAPYTLLTILATDVFVFYFVASPIFGYVELREETVFIKFGFILKREIPYKKIRGFGRERKWYADSMLALKNSLDHVNIKYNSYDMVSVSVKDNDRLISEIEARITGSLE